MKKLKRISKVTLIVIIAGALLWRVKLHFVPAGAKPLPYLFDSSEARSVTSPQGRDVFYRFREPEANNLTPSFTWCYTDHWLTGKKVVAAGYSLPAVTSGDESIPWYWHEDGKDFSVRFTVGPDDETIRWFSGRVE